MQLQGREASITAGELRVSSDGQATPLRVKFSVHRDNDGQTPDSCKVQIFGLNADSRGALDRAAGKPMRLIAGYRDNTGAIYSGRVARAWSEHGPSGWVSHVEADDGAAQIKKRVTVSRKKDTKPSELFKSVTDQMGASAAAALEQFKKLEIKKGLTTLGDGLAMSGTAGEMLDEIAGIANIDWGIANGELWIAPEGETAPGLGVLLNRQSGLIGAPSRHHDTQRPKAFMVKAKSLLQAALLPGRLVLLESEGLSGSFKLVAVEHTGDLYGPEFYSEIIASRVEAKAA